MSGRGDRGQVLDGAHAAGLGHDGQDGRQLQPGEPRYLREDDDRPGTETNIAKLLTSIRGGAAPDVYLADRFTVPQRAAEGVLAELPEAGALKDQYLEFAWNETQFQGKTFALPFDTDARALFYNKDMIAAAGEDPAKLDISNGPATIDEVLAIADKIAKEDANGNYETMGWIPVVPDQAVSQARSTRDGTTPGASRTVASSPTPRRASDTHRSGRRGGLPVPLRFRQATRSEKIARFVSSNMPDPTIRPSRTRSQPESWR